MVDCIHLFLLFGLVRQWVFQVAVKLDKVFELKCKSNWKVQANAPLTNIERTNVNKMDSCLVTDFLFLSCYCLQSEHLKVYSDNKATIFYKNIGCITVISTCSIKKINCWRRVLLDFELPTTHQLCSNESPGPLEKSSGWIVSFFISGSSKNVGTEVIDNQITWKRICHRYQDKTKIKVPGKDNITSGIVTIYC